MSTPVPKTCRPSKPTATRLRCSSRSTPTRTASTPTSSSSASARPAASPRPRWPPTACACTPRRSSRGWPTGRAPTSRTSAPWRCCATSASRTPPASRPPRGTRWATRCSPPAWPVRRSSGCRPGAPATCATATTSRAARARCSTCPQPQMEPILLERGRLTRRGAQLQHRVPRPHPGRRRRHRHASATAAPVRCSPSVPATCSASTAPAHASSSSSACRWRASSPAPAPPTSASRPNLTQYVEHRPSILYWIFNSHAGFGEIGMGLLRAIRPWEEWIAGWGFDMAAGEPDLSDEKVIDQIRTLVGDPNLEPEILTKSLWYVNQQHATRYSEGRVFCGGDAVHRHPPSSGLGSNTSMQDAFNLAWKIAFAVKGYAGPGLLESYSDERAPGREADRRPGQPVPQGLRRPARVVRPRRRRPGHRRPAQAQGPHPRRRRAARAAVRGAGAEEHRVQRPRRRAQPALHLGRRPARPHRSGRRSGPATPSCTCRPPPVPAPSSRTPGSSAPTAAASPPSTSPARAR